ncbi:MAG: hypothetical protein WAU07_00845 [Microgenomates group bacterium]
MQFDKWFKKTTQKSPKISSFRLYFNTTVFGLVVFAFFYAYNASLGIPSLLNKAVADAAVILIGLSMMLSGLCYFWNFVDTKIIYRKYLGLIGFAFVIVHMLLSLSAFNKLVDPAAWQSGAVLPVIEASVATAIFTIMALISNAYAATELGGVVWRRILRTGYIALIFALMHVVLLKIDRWVTWWTEGVSRPPAGSLIVSVFIILVLVLRLALWVSQVLSAKK